MKRRAILQLDAPYGQVTISEKPHPNEPRVTYRVSGDDLAGEITLSPSEYGIDPVPQQIAVQLGRGDFRSHLIDEPLTVKGISVADTLSVDPRSASIPTVHKQDTPDRPYGIHPVPDSIQDFLNLIVALLVDRWVRRDDTEAMRLIVAARHASNRLSYEQSLIDADAERLTGWLKATRARIERIHQFQDVINDASNR